MCRKRREARHRTCVTCRERALPSVYSPTLKGLLVHFRFASMIVALAFVPLAATAADDQAGKPKVLIGEAITQSKVPFDITFCGAYVFTGFNQNSAAIARGLMREGIRVKNTSTKTATALRFRFNFLSTFDEAFTMPHSCRRSRASIRLASTSTSCRSIRDCTHSRPRIRRAPTSTKWSAQSTRCVSRTGASGTPMRPPTRERSRDRR